MRKRLDKQLEGANCNAKLDSSADDPTAAKHLAAVARRYAAALAYFAVTRMQLDAYAEAAEEAIRRELEEEKEEEDFEEERWFGSSRRALARMARFLRRPATARDPERLRRRLRRMREAAEDAAARLESRRALVAADARARDGSEGAFAAALAALEAPVPPDPRREELLVDFLAVAERRPEAGLMFLKPETGFFWAGRSAPSAAAMIYLLERISSRLQWAALVPCALSLALFVVRKAAALGLRGPEAFDRALLAGGIGALSPLRLLSWALWTAVGWILCLPVVAIYGIFREPWSTDELEAAAADPGPRGRWRVVRQKVVALAQRRDKGPFNDDAELGQAVDGLKVLRMRAQRVRREFERLAGTPAGTPR